MTHDTGPFNFSDPQRSKTTIYRVAFSIDCIVCKNKKITWFEWVINIYKASAVPK